MDALLKIFTILCAIAQVVILILWISGQLVAPSIFLLISPFLIWFVVMITGIAFSMNVGLGIAVLIGILVIYNVVDFLYRSLMQVLH